MGIPGSMYLRRALLALLMVRMGQSVCVAQGQRSAHTPPATSHASENVSGDPFARVIGSHLVDWMKPGVAGKSPAGTLGVRKEIGPALPSGLRVNAPSFVAAPFASLPATSSNGTAGLVAADLRKSGKLDAVVARGDGTLDIFLNPGSFASLPTLASTQDTSALQYSPAIQELYAADLNGDSYPDLVAMDLQNSAVLVWIGNGDGTFKSAVSYPVSMASGANWLNSNGGICIIGDFNKDGLPDLALIAKNQLQPGQTTTLLSEQTFINVGGGKFTPGKEVDVTFNDIYQLQYGGGDLLTTDGKTVSGIVFPIADSGASNPAKAGSSLLVMTSNGDGSFTAPIEPTAALFSNAVLEILHATNLTANFKNFPLKYGSILGTGMASTDILSVVNGALYDSPYTAGSGSPTSARLLVGAYQGAGFQTSPTGPNTTFPISNDTNLQIADFDGDGYLDAIVTMPGSAYVFPNGGAAAFATPPSQIVTPGGTAFVAGDFDGSGYASLLWGDNTLPQLAYYQNLGVKNVAQAGEFYAAPTLAGTALNNGATYNVFGGNIHTFEAVDLNGDGLLDVLASDASSEYLVGPNQVTPIVVGFNTGAAPSVSQKSGFKYVTALSSATLSSLFANQYVVHPTLIRSGKNVRIVLSDGAATSNAIYVATLDPTGTAGSPIKLTFAADQPGCNMNFADSGDLNGDGIPDIVVAYGGDFVCVNNTPGSGVLPGGFFTFFGNADGTFQSGQFTALGTEIYKIKLMDLTGTGKLDAVAIDAHSANSAFGHPGVTTYNVYLLTGNGVGGFTSAINIAPNYIATDAIAGDFNGDGIPDLTLTTEGYYDAAGGGVIAGTSGVLQFAGKGSYSFAPPLLVDEGHFPATATYADMNADGTRDLVVSEFTSGPGGAVTAPQLEIYPNVGGGVLAPGYTEAMVPFDFQDTGAAQFIASPLFVGNWGSGGNADLLVQGTFTSAVFLNRGAPALSLSASTATANQNAAVSFIATLSQGGATLTSATGVVTFSAGGTTLGSTTITAGVATLTTNALPVGANVVTASYTGDADAVSPTASTNVTVNAVTPAFTMTAETGSVSLPQGASTSIVLTLVANPTFSGPITLTCSGAPAESTCMVSPSSVSLTPGQSASASVVIATTAKNNHYHASNRTNWKDLPAGVSLAGVLLLLLPRKRRRRSLGVLCMAVLAVTSLVLIAGCDNGGDAYPGTPVGTTTLTISATSGSLTQSQTIAMTVTSSGQ
ncbi:FG-GAP-like repeat-containing protein [Granulicella cerasi]|uniref:FG-GAP-like repeat-containing protein n=1 Tax=Granulicella cerasi TaxID=741063 RepID=A0ABW1ZDN2_9BACT|nr:FG-GAP-like repeat-containing protein [Granulicella cerasi]